MYQEESKIWRTDIRREGQEGDGRDFGKGERAAGPTEEAAMSYPHTGEIKVVELRLDRGRSL